MEGRVGRADAGANPRLASDRHHIACIKGPGLAHLLCKPERVEFAVIRPLGMKYQMCSLDRLINFAGVVQGWELMTGIVRRFWVVHSNLGALNVDRRRNVSAGELPTLSLSGQEAAPGTATLSQETPSSERATSTGFGRRRMSMSFDIALMKDSWPGTRWRRS